jgi:hypothetical protein
MDTRNMLKKVKFTRLSPVEQFLTPILSDLTPLRLKMYPFSTFYTYKGELYFEQDLLNSFFKCHSKKIIDVVNKKYKLSYADFQKIMCDLLKENLNITGYDMTTWHPYFINVLEVEFAVNNFKKKL